MCRIVEWRPARCIVGAVDCFVVRQSALLKVGQEACRRCGARLRGRGLDEDVAGQRNRGREGRAPAQPDVALVMQPDIGGGLVQLLLVGAAGDGDEDARARVADGLEGDKRLPLLTTAGDARLDHHVDAPRLCGVSEVRGCRDEINRVTTTLLQPRLSIAKTMPPSSVASDPTLRTR